MESTYMLTRRQFIGGTGAAVAATTLPRDGRANEAQTILVSVLTCPRPRGASYVAGTLASIDADLPLSVPRLLVCDVDELLVDGWVSAVVPPHRRARGAFNENRTAGWVAIRTAWTMRADLLFLEDDIRPLRRGAFSAMLQHKVPASAAFTSYFSFGRPPGVHDAREFRQSQAIKIPLRSLEALVRAEIELPFPLNAAVWVDRAIGVVGWSRRWTFEQTTNLVEHIGLYSAAAPT